MSESNYVAHLKFLKTNFADAIYYPHPKETTSHALNIFGEKFYCRPNEPLESWFRKTGIPSRVTSVCSTTLLLISINNKSVTVDLIDIDIRYFDGFKGDTLEKFKRSMNGFSDLTVRGIQNYIISILAESNICFNVLKQN
jgi:hypothetical protein